MKFTRLKIEGALSHRMTDVTMDSLTVYRGSNGSGKSTVQNCLNALVTGRPSFVNEKGSGIESIIRAGEDKCVITAEVGDAGETRILRASITEKSGRTPTCKKADDAGYTGTDYLAMLAMNRDVLRVLIDGSWFFNPLRSEADQKELLASIILPATVEFDEWVWPAMTETGIGTNIKRDQKPFELIGDCYDTAFKERTAVNRYIKDWREPEKPSAQPATVADIRQRLKDRQDKRTETAVKKGSLIGDWEKQKSAGEKAGQRVQTLKTKLSSEQWKLEDVSKGLLSKAAQKEHEKIAAEADKAKKIDSELVTVRADIAAQRKALNTFTDVAEAGNCPTCLRELPEDAILGITDPMAARIAKLSEREHELLKQRQGIGDVEGAQKNLDAHATAEKQATLVNEHIREVEKDLAEAEKAAKAEITAQPDTTAIDAELSDFDRRIEMGNTALQEAIRAEAAVETYKKAMDAKVALDKKKESLEKLLDYFGPKGISAKLLDESVAPFEASMNKVLAGWGFECRLQFSPFAMSARHLDSEHFFSLKTMSKSQNKDFHVAFQVALAKVTGFNFVVVDEADIWLGANRIQLFKNLAGAGLEQVIILESEDDPFDQRLKKAGRVFYQLSLDKSVDPPVTVTERL